MKKLLFLVAAVLIAMGAWSTASASDEKSLKAAEELLTIVGMEQMLERSIDEMMAIQLQRNPALIPYEGVMSEFLVRHMNFEELKPQMIALYADAFTLEELEAIIAFYKTPAGMKTISAMPELMNKGAQLGAERVRKNIGELEEMIKAESERMRDMQADE